VPQVSDGVRQLQVGEGWRRWVVRSGLPALDLDGRGQALFQPEPTIRQLGNAGRRRAPEHQDQRPQRGERQRERRQRHGRHDIREEARSSQPEQIDDQADEQQPDRPGRNRLELDHPPDQRQPLVKLSPL
jgi:hypothetical protein